MVLAMSLTFVVIPIQCVDLDNKKRKFERKSSCNSLYGQDRTGAELQISNSLIDQINYSIAETARSHF
jgi:hypothetical protein